jgi:hypothetical protein
MTGQARPWHSDSIVKQPNAFQSRTRSPDGAQRNPALSQHSGLQAEPGHTSTPCPLSGQRPPGLPATRRKKPAPVADMRNPSLTRSGAGQAGLLLSRLPGGACGTLERFTAPAAPCGSTWRPVPKHRSAAAREEQRRGPLVKAARPQKQDNACVPHATDLSACNSQRQHVLAP